MRFLISRIIGLCIALLFWVNNRPDDALVAIGFMIWSELADWSDKA